MKNNHFIIIGGQRCGSTFLSNLLDQHPEIQMAKPSRPEPKYFLNNNLNVNEYFSKYFPESQHKVTGEKSTSYYEINTAAQNIYKHIPSVKIIFIFRNPVDRALSNYFFSLNNNLETRSLEEVFVHNSPEPNLNIEISVNPFNYITRGKYELLLKPYLNLFSKNMHFVEFEDLVSNVDVFANKIYKFLGVKNCSTINVDAMVRNTSKKSLVDEVIRKSIAVHYENFDITKRKLLKFNDE